MAFQYWFEGRLLKLLEVGIIHLQLRADLSKDFGP